ncbi:hypothetical protein LVB87_05810 [Lysobacter sp. KIS68-7]|uniref:hypothetical protein n=1 Tax=Lysobacter sp. KIS68-7 TaxID=2904252 RepID=UPI001E5747AA|nr:hypothetical protein [Lysobacter sp. KIS68-7]UHQ20657.1 hypothetical protein LVB87_05810 [Lysobacter sp. KIS68-7]
MTRNRFAQFLLTLALAPSIASAIAAETPTTTRDSGDAVHLFGYTPKPGMEEQFDSGYQKHLAWHHAHQDPLVWYGWSVTHGPRMGMFIDGTFGAPFAAFDQRVAPAEDGKDADRTFMPFAQPAFREAYRLRRDLSTGTPLEQWQPTSMVEVRHYKVKLGKTVQFEQLAKRMRDVAGGKGVYTWYQGVGGTASPEYMLMVARDGWASFDRVPGDLESALASVDDAATGRQLLAAYAASVDEVTSEIWRYRSEMSLIPSNTSPQP